MSDLLAEIIEQNNRDLERLIKAEADRDALVKALEQIAIVCTDNMDRNCNHRMALDFVRQIANSTSVRVGQTKQP